jgi:sugar lactone lactonase YvrE
MLPGMLRSLALFLLAGLALAPSALAGTDTFSRVMGNGTAGYGNPPAPALEQPTGYPEGVAVFPDGSFLVTDYLYGKVLKVQNGIASVVAGGGSSTADGVAATTARLGGPTGVAVLPDGGFLVADALGNKVRKVSPQGVITTVAGDGSLRTDGDGGAATSAGLYLPWDVELMPDGGFVVSQPWSYKVRRVSPDGTIRTILGDGAEHFPNDVPGTMSGSKYPHGLAVMKNGDVLVAEDYGAKIRRIDAQGYVRHFAGSGTDMPAGISQGSEDGKDARIVGLGRLCDVEIAPDDSVFVTQSDCGPQPNERANNRYYLIGRIADGTYTRWAGTGYASSIPSNMEGKHRQDANTGIGRMRGLAFFPDGDLLFMENTRNIAWRVDSDIPKPSTGGGGEQPGGEEPGGDGETPGGGGNPGGGEQPGGGNPGGGGQPGGGGGGGAPLVTPPGPVPSPNVTPRGATPAAPAKPAPATKLSVRRGGKVTLKVAGRRKVRIEIRKGGRRVSVVTRTPKRGTVTITAPKAKGTYTVKAGTTSVTLTVR